MAVCLLAGCLLSCRKEFTCPQQSRVEFTFDWQQLPSAAEKGEGMSLRFYASDGQVYDMESDTGSFRGSLPVGSYQVLLRNRPMPGILFRDDGRFLKEAGIEIKEMIDRNDSLLLQSRSILNDSLSWELKQVIFLPPDSSGRQPLQSLTVARLQQVSSSIDSLASISATQQSYTARTVEQIQKQEIRHTSNYRILILTIAGFCFLIGRVIYIKRKL